MRLPRVFAFVLVFVIVVGYTGYTTQDEDLMKSCKTDCSVDVCLCFANGPKKYTAPASVTVEGENGPIEQVTEFVISQTQVHCGAPGEHAACKSVATNAVVASPWINVLVLAPIAYRILFHIGTYLPQAALGPMAKRLALHLLVVFSRAGLYLVTAGLEYSDHIVLCMMIVAILAVEAEAACVEAHVEIVQRIAIVAYAAAGLYIATLNSYYTAKHFHTLSDVLQALAVGSVFPIVYVVALSKGSLLYKLGPKPQSASE